MDAARIPIEDPERPPPESEAVQFGKAQRSLVFVSLTIVGLTCAAILGTVVLLEFAFDLRWLRDPLTQFTVHGVTVDETTGTPIANARVIVFVRRRGTLKEVNRCYGVVTNDRGEFGFSRTAPFPLKSAVGAHACAPDGRVDYRNVYATSSDDEYVADLTLELAQPTNNSDRRDGELVYDEWKSIGSQSEIEFIGTNWLDEE